MAYLHTLPDEEDEAVNYDIVLEPPVEGHDSDVDDLNNDDVIVEENVNLLGSRLLAMPANITINTRSGERRQMDEPDTENAAPSLSCNKTKKSTTYCKKLCRSKCLYYLDILYTNYAILYNGAPACNTIDF